MQGEVWSEERTQKLIHLLKVKGLSGHQAARELGCTPCAVIGKVHRLRGKGIDIPLWPQGVTSSVPKRMKKRAAAQRVKVRVEKARQEYKSVQLPNGKVQVVHVRSSLGRLLLRDRNFECHTVVAQEVFDLADNQCRWPIRELDDPKFCFCSNARTEGVPYCEFHLRKAAKVVND